MTEPYGMYSPPLLTEGNPFAKKADRERYDTYEPGTPWWWLDRLIQKLVDRYERFDVLERYALGNHPLPNTDYRYARALRDLQSKARTNYCELVIKATTQRMKVKGFRFGPAGQADNEAKRIWDYNDMDYQSPMNLNLAAVFGVCYALISPPDPSEDGGEPRISIEDPRMCVTERDPSRITRSLAGLKIWEDDTLRLIVAVLYLPQGIFTFTSRKHETRVFANEATLTKQFTTFPAAASFDFAFGQPNPLGECPLVEGNWQPAFGELSRAEHEGVLDIQDRINHTVLDRLIIGKTQSYRQRWATGISPQGKKGDKRPPFDPGADVLWVTANPEANFGDFDVADISKILEAVRDDVGDMAAISQTPATYLMNRMVNVSGDTLTQDQSALITKVHTREEAIGWFYERIMKLCFKYKKDNRWKEVEASTLWSDPEIRTLAEAADALGKYAAAGIPIQIAMERANFSPDEIEFAVKERDRIEAEVEAKEMRLAEQQHKFAMEQQKVKATSAGSGTASKPAAKK